MSATVKKRSYLFRFWTLASAVATVIGGAFSLWQWRQACAPTPVWECIWSNREVEARQEWENRISRTTSKQEIASFVKQYASTKIVAVARARLLIAEAWEQIDASEEPKAIRRFVDRYSDEAFAQLAAKRLTTLDQQLWRKAATIDSRSAYENYLDVFPLGEFRSEASGRLLAITDAELWDATRARNSIEAYRNYLERMPQGRHLAEARFKVAEIEEAAAWARASEDRLAPSVRGYIRDWPAGRHLPQAFALLSQLDDRDWTTVERAPSVVGLRSYLAEWPRGRHAAEAAIMLAGLDDKAWTTPEGADQSAICEVT